MKNSMQSRKAMHAKKHKASLPYADKECEYVLAKAGRLPDAVEESIGIMLLIESCFIKLCSFMHQFLQGRN